MDKMPELKPCDLDSTGWCVEHGSAASRCDKNPRPAAPSSEERLRGALERIIEESNWRYKYKDSGRFTESRLMEAVRSAEKLLAALSTPPAPAEPCDVCAMPKSDRIRPCGNCKDPDHAAWECAVSPSPSASEEVRALRAEANKCLTRIFETPSGKKYHGCGCYHNLPLNFKHTCALSALVAAPVAPSDDVVREIASERHRQKSVEGWSAEHDDEHGEFALSDAAACYASDKGLRRSPSGLWPWAMKWWKPTTHRRNLIKAAALIVAEIERLDRAAPSAPSAEPKCAQCHDRSFIDEDDGLTVECLKCAPAKEDEKR